MKETNVLEKFILLEAELRTAYEKEDAHGLRLVYLEFERVIHSMHEVIRKISRCEMLEELK